MHLRLIPLAFAWALVGLSCGAEELEAPAAESRGEIMQCQGLDRLMPNFVLAISQGRTENLRHLVETQLLTPLRAGDAPPVNDVMRSLFQTVDRFARQPPELGAPEGLLCAPTASPPALEQSNQLCELRRAMDLLVHQGKGGEAVDLVQPQLDLVLGYVTGEGLDCQGRPRGAHYELAAVVSGLCTQDGNCQLNNGLDLVIAFSSWARTSEGRAFIQHLHELSGKNSIKGLLSPTALSEQEMVALIRGFLPALQTADAVGLESAFNTLPVSDEVKTDLRPVIDDLKLILSRPELIVPLRKVLTCLTARDKNLDLVRMAYRLGIAEACPQFGLTRLVTVLKDLEQVDSRGSLVYLVGTLAAAVRSDETAIDSAALVCQTLLSTNRAPGESRSNAELSLPVAADLVRNGVINEAICAVDTLVFGCSGGPQPACQ